MIVPAAESIPEGYGQDEQLSSGEGSDRLNLNQLVLVAQDRNPEQGARGIIEGTGPAVNTSRETSCDTAAWA